MEYKVWKCQVIQHGVGKKKENLIESTVDIGKEREEDL